MSKWHFVVLVIFAGVALALRAQEAAQSQLTRLYTSIFAGYENGKPPKFVDVTNILDTVPQMKFADVSVAVPLIASAIQSSRPEIRSYGELGLFAINQRSDSGGLISNLVPLIARNLNDPDRHIRSGAILALSEMKPKPSEEAINYLKADLAVDSELGAGIIFGLVQADPNREDIAQAIRGYLESPKITAEQKVDTLNALASRPVENRAIIDEMIQNLTGQPEDVQLAAIRSIRRAGQIGIEAARAQLQQLVVSTQSSEILKAAAKAALNPPSAD